MDHFDLEAHTRDISLWQLLCGWQILVSGDPVWEEAVHRDFFDNYWWWLYHKMHSQGSTEVAGLRTQSDQSAQDQDQPRTKIIGPKIPVHSINPEEHEYIPIPIQNRQKFDFYEEKLARRNQEIEKRGKLSLTVPERKLWLTKLRLQTRDCVNTTSI